VPNKTPIFDAKSIQLNIGQRSQPPLNKLAENPGEAEAAYIKEKAALTRAY